MCILSLKSCFSRLHVKRYDKSMIKGPYLWHESDVAPGVVSFVIFKDKLLTRLAWTLKIVCLPSPDPGFGSRVSWSGFVLFW